MKTTTLLLIVALGLLCLPACGSRKRYVINKALDSSATRYMGEIELDADATRGEIEVTDHKDAYKEIQLTCKNYAEVSNVVFHFENGQRWEVDGIYEFTEDEPHWEIEMEQTDSAIKRVEFNVRADVEEEFIVKLYGFVDKD